MDEHENDKSCEPMDIDLSAHSVSHMEISYVEPNIETLEILPSSSIKKEINEDIVTEKNINLKPLNINQVIAKHTKYQNKTLLKQWFKYLLCILVLLFSTVIYQTPYFTCSDSLNIHLLKDLFASKVFGQASSTKSLVKALEAERPRKIIILYGGTGVGKTYTSSMILENLLNYGNIYHYTMPGFTHTTTDFMFGLIFCKSTLIIVDDLKITDILKIEDIIKDLIGKSEENLKDITIILIYNIDNIDEQFNHKLDEDFVYKLNKSLGSIDAEKYYIKFNSLTNEHLRKCIESEFPEKKFNESVMNDVMKNFNVKTDGCKGVHQKVKYFSIV